MHVMADSDQNKQQREACDLAGQGLRECLGQTVEYLA